jgi:hypothetical protein
MAAMVKSVESFDLVLAASTVVSGTLTKSQDMDNCVPFISIYESSSTGGYMDRLFCDVYFSDAGGTPTVRAERADGTGNLHVLVYVVEFDSNEVYVEQGEIDFAGTTDSTTISGSTASGTVDTDRAAMTFSYQVTGTGSTEPRDYFVRGDLTSTTVSWQRGDSSGAISGHYYIFEALNDQFRVIRASGSTTTTTNIHTDDIYNWRKTFIIGSFYTTNSSDDPQHSFAYAYMRSRNIIVHSKTGGTGTMYSIFFVIEFLNTEKTHVEQGALSLPTTGGLQTSTIDLNRSFDLNYSMVMPVYIEGICKVAGTSYTQNPAGFTGMEFNSASQIAIKRNTYSLAGYTSWQVVDWQGVTHTASSPATPLENTIVKTVEAVNITFNNNGKEQLYKYVELTKGQDISNCVVFETHEAESTSGYPGRIFSIVWLEEPNLLGISRGYLGGTLNSTAYVVEFDPTRVNVQHGMTLLKQVSNITDTITSVDLSKTAIIHYAEVATSNTLPYNFVTRASFDDSTTVQFRRGSTSSSMVVSYFIFEAVDDEFEVDTYSSSSSGQYTINADDAFKKHHTFVLSSYYMSYAGDDPQYAFSRTYMYDEHNIYSNINAYSGTYYYNLFVVTLKYAPNKILVQNGFITHSTAATTETDDILVNVDLNSSSAVHAMRGFTRGAGTSYTQNQAASIRHKITDVDEIEFFRQTHSLQMQTWWQVIDWAGYESAAVDASNIQQGMVKTIEHISDVYSATDDYYHFLSKGQDINNCVPFPTYSITSSADRYDEALPIFYFYEPNIFKVVRRSSGGDIDLNVSIVEFNPNEIKVQSGEIWFNTTSDTATIETVDLDKAFIVAYTYTNTSTTLTYDAFIRADFSDSSTVRFTRGGSSGYAHGYYWVIEDIGGNNFDVLSYNQSGTGTSLNVSIPYTVDFTKSAIFTSYYMSYAGDDPQYAFRRVILRAAEGLINLNSAAASGSYYAAVFVVKFNSDRVRTQFVYNIFGTSDTSMSNTILEVDPDRSITTCLNAVPVGRLDSATTNTQMPAAFFKTYLSANGTQFNIERDYTASLTAYTHGQIIEFPINTHYFSGNVTENNVAATRQVYVYDRDTGVLETSATSSGVGGYYLAETTNSGTQFIVALDNLEGDQFNLMGLDLMDPLPID